MIKYKEIPRLKLLQLTEKYNLDLSILDNILLEWAKYLHYADEMSSFEESEEILKERKEATDDWVELSLFYYENKEIIEKNDLHIFEKSVFYPFKKNEVSLSFSSRQSNLILKTYLLHLRNNNKLLEEGLARKMKEIKMRKERRKVQSIFMRNELIYMAASYLKVENISTYAPLIRELLLYMDIANMKDATIRKIVFEK